MWVCVSKENLWFLRINSKRYDENCVSLLKEIHAWLEHDSFIRCGGELVTLTTSELSVRLAKQDIPERQGILGSIDLISRINIHTAAMLSKKLTSNQKEIISRELGF